MKRRTFLSLPFGAAAALAFSRDAPAPAPVRVVEQEWQDAGRSRVVPVRVYAPAAMADDKPAARHAVILFSHGLGGSRAGGEQWGRLWAAHGFVSVHLQHHGSDEALWKDKNPLAGFASLRRAMSVENGMLRAQDVAFALDEMARRRKAEDPFFARTDAERIGLCGHSFGARTTVTVVSTMGERRIRAAIAFSPSPEPGEAANRERFGRIRIPFLHLTGTRDQVPLLNDATPEERRLPFQYMTGPDKYLLVLKDADHMVFNGQPAERKWNDQNRNVHAPLIERASLRFWQAYLDGDAGARAELAGEGFRAAVGANGEWFVK